MERFNGAAAERARLLAGLSIGEVARVIKRTPRVVRDYESGRAFPPVEVIRQMAHRYGCAVDDLYKGGLVGTVDREAIGAIGARTRREQGLPRRITDPETLAQVADVMYGESA